MASGPSGVPSNKTNHQYTESNDGGAIQTSSNQVSSDNRSQTQKIYQEAFPFIEWSENDFPKATKTEVKNSTSGNHKTTQREEKVGSFFSKLKESIGKLIDDIVSFLNSIGGSKKKDGVDKSDDKASLKFETKPEVKTENVASKDTPKTDLPLGKEPKVLNADEAFAYNLNKLGTSDPRAFLRQNNTYSREVREKMDQAFSGKTIVEDVQVKANELSLASELPRTQFGPLVSVSSVNKEQAEHIVGIAKHELTKFLSLEEGGMLSKVPTEVKKTLQERANQILNDPDLSTDRKNLGVRLLYTDAICLKGFCAIVADYMSRSDSRASNKDIELGNNLALTALNGVTKPTRFSPELQNMFGELRNIYVSSFDRAMESIGMPKLND